jgi:hypothetical protein
MGEIINMKYIINFYLLTTIICYAFSLPENELEAKNFYDEMDFRIQDLAKKPSHEALPLLSHLLMRFGSEKKFYSPKDRWTRCYLLAQSAMLQIPGHAKFLCNEYEQFRITEKIWEGGVTRYRLLIHKLANIPSPETIQVLGAYLDDFKDTDTAKLDIDKQVIVNKHLPRGEGLICGDLPWLATYALAEIGLRNPPLKSAKLSMYSFDPECTNQWKKTRAWYQEVKAGKRTFSFVGQKVEYRFKPDGTWDTIALTNAEIDDVVAEPPPAPAKPVEALDVLATTPVSVTKETPWWPWLVGAVLVITAIISWRIVAKRREQSL